MPLFQWFPSHQLGQAPTSLHSSAGLQDAALLEPVYCSMLCSVCALLHPAAACMVSAPHWPLPLAGAAPTLPVPPHEDASSAAMLRWLHTIALHLDDAMSSPLLMQPYVLADLEEKPLSAGACFQALLAQAPHPDVPQVRGPRGAQRMPHLGHIGRDMCARWPCAWASSCIGQGCGCRQIARVLEPHAFSTLRQVQACCQCTGEPMCDDMGFDSWGLLLPAPRATLRPWSRASTTLHPVRCCSASSWWSSCWQPCTRTGSAITLWQLARCCMRQAPRCRRPTLQAPPALKAQSECLLPALELGAMSVHCASMAWWEYKQASLASGVRGGHKMSGLHTEMCAEGNSWGTDAVSSWLTDSAAAYSTIAQVAAFPCVKAAQAPGRLVWQGCCADWARPRQELQANFHTDLYRASDRASRSAGVPPGALCRPGPSRVPGILYLVIKLSLSLWRTAQPSLFLRSIVAALFCASPLGRCHQPGVWWQKKARMLASPRVEGKVGKALKHQNEWKLVSRGKSSGCIGFV